MTDAPLGAVTPIETEALNDWLDAVEAGGWVREYLVNGIESTIRAERTKANAARAEAADEVARLRQALPDDPFDRDIQLGCCYSCEAFLYHEPDCKWAAARSITEPKEDA